MTTTTNLIILTLITLSAHQALGAENSTYDVVIPFADLLQFQENITRTLRESVNNSITLVIANIHSYDAYIKGMIDTTLSDHEKEVKTRVEQFKQQIAVENLGDDNNVVLDCIFEEGQLDDLAQQINIEVKNCATIISMEVVNVISDSINEAQTFMTIPEVIGKDIQQCGISPSCLQMIVGDAIAESIQVPPKVLTLAARIQQMTLRTVVSIDSCALKGLQKITKLGMSIIEDVLYCINDNLNPSEKKLSK